jgi:hypothetical protein
VQLDARILGKLRRAKQVAAQIVGPAVQRADDVARIAMTLEQDRLAMPADIRQQLDAGLISQQHSSIVQPRQHSIVADVRHHQLVADVLRPRVEHQLPLARENLRIEIPRDRKLAAGRRKAGRGREVGHGCKALKGRGFYLSAFDPRRALR